MSGKFFVTLIHFVHTYLGIVEVADTVTYKDLNSLRSDVILKNTIITYCE